MRKKPIETISPTWKTVDNSFLLKKIKRSAMKRRGRPNGPNNNTLTTTTTEQDWRLND